MKLDVHARMEPRELLDRGRSPLPTEADITSQFDGPLRRRAQIRDARFQTLEIVDQLPGQLAVQLPLGGRHHAARGAPEQANRQAPLDLRKPLGNGRTAYLEALCRAHQAARFLHRKYEEKIGSILHC